ncbi:hypothetical protein JI435_400270, partial [Parastagonospora nodorum SN15]
FSWCRRFRSSSMLKSGGSRLAQRRRRRRLKTLQRHRQLHLNLLHRAVLFPRLSHQTSASHRQSRHRVCYPFPTSTSVVFPHPCRRFRLPWWRKRRPRTLLV